MSEPYCAACLHRAHDKGTCSKSWCCCQTATPDHPAEDAREARLSEGEVERLALGEFVEALSEMPQDWPVSIGIGDVDLEIIATSSQLGAVRIIVADMLTQREREVVARLRVAMLQRGHHRNDMGDGEWWVTDSYIAECLDRALGGTADGQGT